MNTSKSMANGSGPVIPLHLRRDWQTAAALQAQTNSWTEQA